MNTQFFFCLVHQIERILTFTVHLVHENHDGCLAHAAHFHQAPCLRLNTFGAVDDDDRTIHSGQGTEGVFRKVLVTRGVENIDMIVLIIEAHDGGRYGYTTLLLDLHPVGGRRLADLVGLDHMNRTAVEQ